eukprot:gene2838-2771_t
MGGLAALAREAGHRVTGCDAGVYPPMSEQLRALGIDLIEGFGADQMALKPDLYVIGNVVSRARLPDGMPKFPLMEAILEAGRSKFVHYRPRTAILNNLEFDHADIFDNLAAIERQFHHLVRTIPGSGRVVVNGLEESLTRVLAQGCWSDVRTFGSTVSDFVAEGDPSSFQVRQAGHTVAQVQWTLGGVHNQLNALAAIAASEHIGVSPNVAAQALSSFENVKRRMEVRGTVNGITVYDDFAHHPTAIRTTINGLRRQIGPHARILAIFEPRSNTMKLGTMKAQLPWSLEEADLAFCHSGGLDWDANAALAPMGERAQVGANVPEVIQQVLAQARPGDHLLCMSNGGFGGIHTQLLTALGQT